MKKKLSIGIIKETKIPEDNRVALTPQQCAWLKNTYSDLEIIVQSSDKRCFSDSHYIKAGITVSDSVASCDILLGIKEIKPETLIPNKTYLFFSHTKKKQAYNQQMLKSIIAKNIRLIDYECLVYNDGTRILGFGFFAGVVGAHNGIMAYLFRKKIADFIRVSDYKDYRNLIHTYFSLKLPPIKIAVTGTGKVGHGILEVLNMLGVQEVSPSEFLSNTFEYPAFVHLKSHDLYIHQLGKPFEREDFHHNPEHYRCTFEPYCFQTDILLNGMYWDKKMEPLFKEETIQNPSFRIETIADITNDYKGSIICNLGESTIQDPVYGIDKKTLQKTQAYQSQSLDLMCIGNLPNELPRDSSRYFGEQLIKHIIPLFYETTSPVLERATICENKQLTKYFDYLSDYVT